MDNDKQLNNVQINIYDFYGEDCLKDKMDGIKHSGNRGPKGYVEIYEILPDGTKKLLGKPNLVLYLGREWLAQRLFNANNVAVTSGPGDFIYWVGLGDGGVPVGDPLNPTAPTNTDTGLDNDIMINATDGTNADYRLAPVAGYYKQPIDGVEFEQDADNNNSYLIVKVTITVGASNGNGYNLSEAGLFTAPSSSGGETGPFTIYARVTFPSIVKTSSRILTFIWYIFV
jgi:hypothetical protein